jgi:hypothetical protein
MKRIAILIGATVLLLGTFGSSCSVHCMMQKVMRSCALAAQHHDLPAQPVPARAKKQPIASVVARALPVAIAITPRLIATDAITYRSFISLGAVRCDRDVGVLLI